MIKHITILIFSIFLSACISNPENSNKTTIAVSILPQKYFVESIAGDKFDVTVMIPPGGTPETYEPTARQMKSLSGQVVYMKIGHIPFEEIWLHKIEEINPRMKITDLSEGIEFIGSDHHHGDAGRMSAVDPHIWTSPKNAAIIAANIYNYLCVEDPENKDYYAERYKIFLNLTDSLDRKFQAEFLKHEVKSFLIFHPALAYLARDYGLEQVSIEFEGKSPPPGYMRDVIKIAREKKIKKILIQKQFNSESAITIAKEIGGKVVVIDPLDEKWDHQLEYVVAQIISD